ncbi:hypothetical protein D3C74_411150 [compost metagenome]
MKDELYAEYVRFIEMADWLGNDFVRAVLVCPAGVCFSQESPVVLFYSRRGCIDCGYKSHHR